jgi:hypothetical protein
MSESAPGVNTGIVTAVWITAVEEIKEVFRGGSRQPFFACVRHRCEMVGLLTVS